MTQLPILVTTYFTFIFWVCVFLKARQMSNLFYLLLWSCSRSVYWWMTYVSEWAKFPPLSNLYGFGSSCILRQWRFNKIFFPNMTTPGYWVSQELYFATVELFVYIVCFPILSKCIWQTMGTGRLTVTPSKSDVSNKPNWIKLDRVLRLGLPLNCHKGPFLG